MIKKLLWSGENLTKSDGVFAANVPGNIQLDYAIAKSLPDYQIGDNSKNKLS